MDQLYPEIAAGGFSRDDHHVLFYTRVRSLLRPEMEILDFGAGRGKFATKFANDRDSYRLRLLDLRGSCARVTGCDVDLAVKQNPLVDEAVVIDANNGLPFENSRFDLVVAWAVFEHLDQPDFWAAEIARVLKPGGWLCAWTPNKWGVVGLGGRLVPNRWHRFVLERFVHAGRNEHDIFPTRYRMNTRRTLRRLFPEATFLHATYSMSGPPTYVIRSRVATAATKLYQALPCNTTDAFLHIFIQKREISSLHDVAHSYSLRR